jgi:hypothetical protein
MPIIYTYPSVTPTADDLLLISDVSSTNPTKATRKCTVGDIVSLVGALVPGGGTVTSVELDFQTTGLTTSGGTSQTITTTGSFDIAGTLVCNNGGTGLATADYANGNVLFYNNAASTTKLQTLTIGGAGQVLTVAGGLPTWATPTVAPVTSVAAIAPATQAATNPIVVTPTTGLVTIQSLAYDGGTKAGHVPGTSGGDVTKYLNGGGAFTVPPDTNTTYSAMTDAALGLGKLRYTVGATPAAQPQSTTAGRTYGVTANGSDQLIVNVPWTGSPGRVNYDNQLAFKGGSGGTYVPNISRKAQYWVSGDKVYMEFLMEWNTSHAAMSGTMIMTNLPLSGISPTGASNEQGSAVITVNDGLGSSGDGTGAPTTGRPGVTGSNEIIFRSHNGLSGIFFDSLWANTDGDYEGNYILAGTISWFTGALV